ncbi:vitamin B12-dependent ribonucleoside-diphosphate reductase-like [Corticium candelabrum]|uniref:vitamin B12-dependent ribonucleoside-diphosphate reductase-like n=1 Tax=Corticium candelabrum TaxID=121492 RepID=UPI002E2591CC|nr:vitamin B12-dependent ribonucleoside-diphosphate reductase-like [Corticium candelabrum]XP_062509909.1 vitamin B12-dependent ribonucleoside-diphosphate reductase-like [Corticium candelabrum]XP_062509915.1 vitamin B12-dependent ribonucleoside-diphosphate reductase-like [Corticium candelabrum]XP_062509923.1 vitamin B12-dependent ribonucleoside-diphosphate reductase-like [Corticium candelabrum]XP_062509929.1 vitamin B12-dependent ribonucleoside-diphosphate reductase-like [Corticium candelabrum]
MNKLLARYAQAGELSYTDIIRRVVLTLKSDLTSWGLHLDSISELTGARPGATPRFIPAGRTLATANPQTGAILPNCTVLRFDSPERKPLLQQTVGIGTNFDEAKSEDDLERMLRKAASEPQADGSGRTPGLMGTLHWKHPAARKFVSCKTQPGHGLRNFNLSLLVDNSSFFREPLSKFSALCAWECGDPGILFTNRINSERARGRNMEEMTATAPCGELFLHEREVCTLGNLNLTAYVCDSKFDLGGVARDVDLAVRFLDCVIDHYSLPSSAMRDVTNKLRRIGLGVMGWATTLKSLGIDYSSSEALDLASSVAYVMRKTADRCSRALANEKGCATAACAGRRNVTCLALPPTGGTAPLIGVSYGIEPEFNEAHRISPLDHIRMQAAWQKHIDAAVSKTVNLPSTSTPSDVEEVFQMAWKFDCKGVTVYRDNATVEAAACSTECAKPFILQDSTALWN